MRLLTNDLYEGAWLLSQGVELADLWMDDKARRAVIFEFHGENVVDLQNEYKKGKAEVNVVKLKGALKQLKDKMFWLLRTKELNETKFTPLDHKKRFTLLDPQRKEKWETRYQGRRDL